MQIPRMGDIYSRSYNVLVSLEVGRDLSANHLHAFVTLSHTLMPLDPPFDKIITETGRRSIDDVNPFKVHFSRWSA